MSFFDLSSITWAAKFVFMLVKFVLFVGAIPAAFFFAAYRTKNDKVAAALAVPAFVWLAIMLVNLLHVVGYKSCADERPAYTKAQIRHDCK